MFGRKVLVVILLLLGVSWVNFAIPTPKDVGALEWLLKLLSPCFRVTEVEEYGVQGMCSPARMLLHLLH